jgi:VanZ family protein
MDSLKTRLKWWWPAIVWGIVISTFSTAAFTSENTSRIIIPALHWLLPQTPTETLAVIHHYIRKSGHLTEYFILSLLLLRGIRGDRRGLRLGWTLLAIAIVFCYASLDEFHQSFVPGRTPAFSDVLLDTCGGAAAQIVAELAMLRRKGGKEREAVEPNSAG